MSKDSSKQALTAETTGTKHSRWSPVTAIVVVLISFLIIPVIVQLALIATPHILGWSQARADDWVMNAPLSNFLYVLFAETLTIGMLIGFARYKHVAFRAMTALGKPRWRDIGHALLGIMAYFGVFTIVLAAVQQFVNLDVDQKQALGFTQGIGGIGLVMAFVSLVLLPPIAEEIIFRGFFYGTLRNNKVKAWPAILFTSLFFASLHLFGAAEGGLLWTAFVDVFSLSIVLCYLREQNGTIWASMGVHALKNGFVFLNLFVIHAH
jgi:membrane protease YdiL (CAAX protease family)